MVTISDLIRPQRIFLYNSTDHIDTSQLNAAYIYYSSPLRLIQMITVRGHDYSQDTELKMVTV